MFTYCLRKERELELREDSELSQNKFGTRRPAGLFTALYSEFGLGAVDRITEQYALSASPGAYFAQQDSQDTYAVESVQPGPQKRRSVQFGPMAADGTPWAAKFKCSCLESQGFGSPCRHVLLVMSLLLPKYHGTQQHYLNMIRANIHKHWILRTEHLGESMGEAFRSTTEFEGLLAQVSMLAIDLVNSHELHERWRYQLFQLSLY